MGLTVPRRLNQRLLEYIRRNPEIIQPMAAFSIKGAGAVLSFGFSMLLARLFGAAGVGQFGLAMTTLMVSSTLSLIGLDYVMIRTVAGDIRVNRLDLARGAIRTITCVITTNAVVLGCFLTFAFVPILNARFNLAHDTAVLAAITFGIVPFALMRVVSSALRSTGKVLLAQVIDGPIPMALAITVTMTLVANGNLGSAISAGVIYTSSLAITVIAGAAVYLRSVRGWPKASPVGTQSMLAQGWRIGTVAVTGFVVDWFILLVLAANASTTEVGQFRMAWQISSLLNLVMVSFDAVSGPRIAAAHRIGDNAAIRRLWRQSIIIMLAMAIPPIFLLVVWAESILGIFGSEFREGAWALRILLLGQVVNLLTGPVGSVLIMTGRDRWSLIYSLSSTAFAIVACLVLMPLYGLLGAAWASAMTIGFRNISAFVIATRTIGMPFSRN